MILHACDLTRPEMILVIINDLLDKYYRITLRRFLLMILWS